MNQMTREEWLNKLAVALRPIIEDAGFKLPEKLRLSCGWPSHKALVRKKRVIGQCWNPECSQDQTTEVFVSPVLQDGVEVAAVALHELVHAAVGTEAGHRGPFIQCARKVGLVGPWTATSPSPELAQRLAGLLPCEYPHATLDMTMLKVKKQGTRMVKCECPDCGYTVRTTRKWLDEKGAPWCPCNKRPMLVDGQEWDPEAGDPEAEGEGEDLEREAA